MRLALSLALVAAAAAGLSRTAAAQQDDLLAARTHGSPTAPVTVYEISDFQCPYCARFWLETMPLLEREYVVPGKVKFVFVNFPLPMHPNAVPAAELAMCAARQGKFWQVHDLLFRNQERWGGLAEPGSYLLSLGDSAGANRFRGEIAGAQVAGRAFDAAEIAALAAAPRPVAGAAIQGADSALTNACTLAAWIKPPLTVLMVLWSSTG